MILLYLQGKNIIHAFMKKYLKNIYIALGFMSLVSCELRVKSPDEITRARLETEAILLDSVVRETECEAVTEREDTYEVIIHNNGVEIRDKYVIGELYVSNRSYRM